MKCKIRAAVRRRLAAVLCLCMFFSSAGTYVFAAEEPAYTGGLCEHHKEHTAECGYVEAGEEQPCAHVHDESCGYQADSEESSCTHIHDDSCGYVEAVEEQPCTYVCEICSGAEDEEPLSDDEEPLSDDEEPLSDDEEPLSDDEEPLSDNEEPLSDNEEPLSEDEEPLSDGAEPLSDGAGPLPGDSAYAGGEIGKRLEGDRAYISKAYLIEDTGTDSGLAIRTGTAPWDTDDPDADGNDGTDLDNKVRSFDLVTYTAAFETKVRDDAPFAAYETGTVHYEFVAEGTEDKVQFDPEAMGWLTAKTEGTYEITEETQDGKTCQVLRGSFLAEPTEGNPSAIGNSYQEVNIALRVLALKKGETVAPRFTFWLEGNSVPDSGLVTGSGASCGVHGEQEYLTITAPDVTVTSAPRFNVQLKAMVDSYSYVDTFDFSTGNDHAANKDAGTKEGRASGYGVTLQIQGKSSQHGLRGCELPDGGNITLELKLSSVYRTDEGEEKQLFGDYPLLLWSIEGNVNALTQADGRPINGLIKYIAGAAPSNKGTSFSACYNGGTWRGSQTENTIHVTVSDYQVDLTKLPHATAGSAESNYSYYNPNEISYYWEVQNACFSAGEVWLVQPFYDNDRNYVAEKEGNGTFVTTVQDVSLKVKGESGTALQDAEDNSNQMTVTDDEAVKTVYFSKQGSISNAVAYAKNNAPHIGSTDQALTDGCMQNGKDWVLGQGELAVGGVFSHVGAEGMNTGVAYDLLIKFDDAFFKPDGTYQESFTNYRTGRRTVLFGAKPDKSGWDHGGKESHEDGYDEEMMKATADDLVFFSYLEELEAAGYTCVAALYECRGSYSSQQTSAYLVVNGTASPEARSGGVYMCTVAGKAWNRADVQAAAAAHLGKDAAALGDEDYNEYVKSEAFPSRAGGDASRLTYADDYPGSFWTYDYTQVNGLRTYQKAVYNENGFVSATAGRNYGDSCLVVDYSTQITKSPNQPGSGEGGKKLSYDMDTSQREVDYVLYPTAVRAKGESVTEGTGMTATVYIEDTLPAGLDYILNSACWGGTYTSNGGGKAGLVTGGQQLYPEITKNADGTTTLLFTLKNVMITPEEITRFDPIYYSCLIGTPGVEETDVVNQQQLLNSVKIWSDGEQIRDFVATNGNYAEQSILISKNRAVSFSKTSDQMIVELGDEMGFTIHHGNNSGNSMQVVDIDFLPHNDDGRGTQITGQVVVSELTVQSRELLKDFTLYYTTDTAKRNTKASDYTAADFTEENGWTKLQVDGATGAVSLPDVTHVIVAVAAVGTLQPNSTLKMHITFDTPDGRPGEYLVNSFGSGTMESNARTYIVDRLLEGVVWLDADMDGLRDDEEDLMNGVKVTLMQKDGNGSYIPYLLQGKSVTVETGKQVDVLTGTVSSFDTGGYCFSHLPQGDFAVKFESGSTVRLSRYTAAQPNVGTDDTIDSDAVPQEQDGRLVSAGIEGIVMPEAEQITVQIYRSQHHDLGLYRVPGQEPETGSLTVSKNVAGDGGETARDFHFKVTLSDASVSGTYGGMEFTDGEAAFTLKHGEQKTASGLPADVTYTVSEQEAGQEGYITTAAGDTGTIVQDQTAAAVFTNTRAGTPPVPGTGNLVVSKTVTGSGGSTAKDFTFTVTLEDTAVQGEYGEMLFRNGVAVFTLKHGESKTASGLPAGTRYTVEESDNSGYTVTASGDTGTIEAGKTSAAAFRNDRDGSSTDNTLQVTVRKVWKLDDGGTAADSVVVMLCKDGKEYARVKLSAQNDWEHTWQGLDDGCDWTVEETDVPEGFTASVNRQGYTFTITNDDAADGSDDPAKPEQPQNPHQPGKPNGSQTDASQAGGSDSPQADAPRTGESNVLRSGAPQTGDSADPAFWMVLAAVSGTGVAGTLVLIKKTRYRRRHRK